MGTYSLRQLLTSICQNLRWDYAVFWRLQHQSGLLLTWEEGYCDYPEPRESWKVAPNNVSISGTTVAAFPNCDLRTFSGISLAVASMSCLLHSFGEGFVGKAASTGKHFWISLDEFNTGLLSDYPDEWQLQFAVGIKTILLVPVVPHGVVQLGSLEKVAQDLDVVAHIKDMFTNLLHVSWPSTTLVPHEDLCDPSPSSQTTVLEDLAEHSAITILNATQSKLIMDKDLLDLDNVYMTQEKLSTINPEIKPQFTAQDNLQVQGRNGCYSGDAVFGATSVGATSVSQNKYPNERLPKVVGTDIPNVACCEKYKRPSSQEIAFAATASMNMKFGPKDGTVPQPTGNVTGKETVEISSHHFFNFPPGSELHKALGSAFHKRCYNLWEPTVFGEDVCSSSSLIYHSDPAEIVETSITESNGWLLKGGNSNNLLGAVVANAYDASGNDACNVSNNARSPTTSSGEFAVSCQTESPSVCNVLRGSHLSPQSNLCSGLDQPSGEVPVSPSSSLKHKTSKLNDEKQQRKGLGQSRKGVKSSHINKKKGRLGDIQKVRPRDRQMIQDRVKELRELVPNGVKCSIDALLQQTITHMLFLRSISNQAEKLKNCIYPEVIYRKKQKLSESQGRHNGGTSWAFELGRQLVACPIVVRDLDQPGHMLIEMLCEEHGLFLEIALVIQRLKLTILKGVMENRSDQMWAYFIVEVSKGFQRMDIFWPLMQLLQGNHHHPMSRVL